MPKTVPPTIGAEATPAVAVKEKKSYTNWEAFAKAGLVPVRVECQAYQPVHQRDRSCHTRLALNTTIPQTLTNHIGHEHGAGFMFSLRATDGKESPLWAQMSDADMEAQDFRCAACNAVLRFHPTSIMPHMKAHRGNTRQAYQELQRGCPRATGFFNLTLGAGQADISVEDMDEFDDS